jgi:hypothetical protein
MRDLAVPGSGHHVVLGGESLHGRLEELAVIAREGRFSSAVWRREAACAPLVRMSGWLSRPWEVALPGVRMKIMKVLPLNAVDNAMNLYVVFWIIEFLCRT